MNLVGSGFWKTFNFKSMKNSKSSTVKSTTTTDDTIAVIKKEYKKASKDNCKSSEQLKSPLLKTFKSNNKHGSFRESTKGGGKGVGVGKVMIHGGNNQIGGSKIISTPPPPSSSSSLSKCNRDSFTMVTNLRRAASVPLMINPSRNNNLINQKNVKQLVNSTATVSTVNQLDNTETMFQYFDTNRSGYISEDELIEMMGSLGEPIDRIEAKLMIKEADVNHDGKIDYPEFRNLINRLPLIFSSSSSMSLREAFNIFDKDADGYVNMEEVKLIATSIGIDLSDKSIDFIRNQLQQSTASSSSSLSSPSPSPSSSKPNSKNNLSDNVKINFDQLKKFFDSIGKK
ncbi:uncharacterized protein LOC128392175 [Panonychus citri]|uniref:uncharacterized protein LOC128392175 n=1 Tax=Panonychus citri TaxID=50023 RepID=UPI002307904B|nr:uncharacterized protein LOC128392175 [Panonychus citri]